MLWKTVPHPRVTGMAQLRPAQELFKSEDRSTVKTRERLKAECKKMRWQVIHRAI